MEHCRLHDLKWVAVWISGHCFMLRRCSGCGGFAIGFVYTMNEPFHNSTNININQIPVDKLQELRIFVSRIEPEKTSRSVVKLKM